MTRVSEITILGGGLAGLSAAYHLRDRCRLFEGRDSIGGTASSFSENGFIFDHAIHILYTNDPYASNLIKSLLGSNFCEQKRSSWIFSHNTYTPYPYQTNMRGLPKSVILENVFGMLRARLQKRVINPEHFEEWIYSRFGKGIAKNFMIPFNEKVWSVAPRQMNCDWMSDRVFVPSLRHLLKGLLSTNQKNIGSNAIFWYPRQGGINTLSEAFSKHIPNIHLQHICKKISPSKGTITFQNGKVISYKSIISSLPLPLLLSMIETTPTPIQRAASLLRANRVITISIGIDRENISNKHWVYFPEKKFIFQRISFPMNFSSSLVPQGMSSIMAEVSIPMDTPIPNLELISEQTIHQLTDIGILQSTDHLLTKKTLVIDPAYIIYDNNRAGAIDEINQYLRSISIIPCGRFGEWSYLNMDQAILSGKRAAEEFASQFL